MPPRRLVATLVANPDHPAVTDEAVAAAARALGQEAKTRILASGIAADLVFEGTDPAAAEARLRPALAERPIDVIVQDEAGRRKRLFLADMDSTMIGQECIDELADRVGLKAQVSAITERAMRGEIAFEPALRERVALLAGLPESVAGEIVARRITLTPGGKAVVATMRAHGAHTALVSGGFTLFTGPIAALLGFHEHRANRLAAVKGRLTGRVEEPILGREAKRAALLELRVRFNCRPDETLAVGDGANDLSMLAEAGLGVAFRAKPAVAAAADARIEHADLTALLYAQGYTADEIVRA